MATYDYRKGKERIEDILDNELKVIEQNEVPTDSTLTLICECSTNYSVIAPYQK